MLKSRRNRSAVVPSRWLRLITSAIPLACVGNVRVQKNLPCFYTHFLRGHLELLLEYSIRENRASIIQFKINSEFCQPIYRT